MHPSFVSRTDVAQLLVQDASLAPLTLDDAKTVLEYMQPKRLRAGTRIVEEGERGPGDFLLLLIEGEVTVESRVNNEGEAMVIAVLGPGSLVGEMALLDERARAASCTATTEIVAAVLRREALQRLLAEHPAIGARLMLSVAVGVAERLRETLRKLKAHVRVNHAMRQELDVMMGPHKTKAFHHSG